MLCKVNRILEDLKSITLLDASELVAKIESTFNVDASISSGSPMIMSAPVMDQEVEEKTEFNVILDEVPPDKKIPILKVVRSITGLGLKEAKNLVESTPQQLQENIGKDSAEDIKKQLEAIGAKITIN